MMAYHVYIDGTVHDNPTSSYIIILCFIIMFAFVHYLSPFYEILIPKAQVIFQCIAEPH